MARSDLLLSLVRAAVQSDATLLERTVQALAAEERGKRHHGLAEQLEAQLRSSNGKAAISRGISAEGDHNLVHEVKPRRSFNDLIVPSLVRTACDELVEEHHRTDLLRSYNLEPRSRVLLLGPPGNGKTSLAESIAEALMVPLLIVRYEAIIGSYLGETALRLLRLFQHAGSRRCVLFFDEFDTVGKERGDTHETGEIKRVVSSLLMQVDTLPSHVVVVAATNHPELLDRAVWRRFQLRLRLPRPGRQQIEDWLERFQADFGQPLCVPLTAIAEKLEGLSFAELEEFGLDVRRRWVLDRPTTGIKTLVVSRIRQWEDRNATRKRKLTPPKD